MVKGNRPRLPLRAGSSFKSGRLISLLILFAVMLVLGRAALWHSNSGWVDLTDPESQIQPSTMNIGQIDASLKEILAQYQSLLKSQSSMSKDSLLAQLNRLYQLSAKDYSNATSLPDPAGIDGSLRNLNLSSSLLASSIFEKEDSLAYAADDFGTMQEKKSRQDLASAITTLAKVDLTPRS